MGDERDSIVYEMLVTALDVKAKQLFEVERKDRAMNIE